jgi:hypothetical protein
LLPLHHKTKGPFQQNILIIIFTRNYYNTKLHVLEKGFFPDVSFRQESFATAVLSLISLPWMLTSCPFELVLLIIDRTLPKMHLLKANPSDDLPHQ